MAVKLELTYRNMKSSAFIESAVRNRLLRLEQRSDQLQSCHVIVESPEVRHRRGRHYEVRVELRVPGSELVVSDNGDRNAAPDDLGLAIHEAFDALERQLVRWKDRRRGEVKRHSAAGGSTEQLDSIAAAADELSFVAGEGDKEANS